MAKKRSAFVLPEGLDLEITDGTLAIRFEGDVRLENNLGREIDEIIASGNVDLKLDTVQGTISAGEKLTVEGAVDGVLLQGRNVVLGNDPITCTAISATESITIGAAKLTVDCIIAPQIDLDPKASGRVTVIESHNERGATKIKGGFSVSDYDDMIGNAVEFLAERGLEALRDGPPPAQDETDDALPEEEEEEDEAEDEDAPGDVLQDDFPDEAQDDDEDIEDPLSLSIDDIEEIVEGGDATATATDELREIQDAEEDAALAKFDSQLAEAVIRITTCYDGSDLPPAVGELQELVQQKDYEALRGNITEVWNGLLGFHQKRGIRPHHQVTHAFNVIHGLLQE